MYTSIPSVKISKTLHIDERDTTQIIAFKMGN